LGFVKANREREEWLKKGWYLLNLGIVICNIF
jgi:hypothetical protein